MVRFEVEAMGKKDFEKLFIEAVDEGLEALGESGKHMIFFHLEKSYSIKRHEIPKKPEAFAEGLEKIFGAGASVLEKLIVKSLYSKLGLEYEDKESRPFAEYVKDVKDTKETNAKDEKENNTRHCSSNQRSLEAKAFQQSSLSYIEMQEEIQTRLY